MFEVISLDLFANIMMARKNDDKHYSLLFFYGLQVGKNDDEQCNYLSSFCYGLQVKKKIQATTLFVVVLLWVAGVKKQR
jgi:hypothetical protein